MRSGTCWAPGAAAGSMCAPQPIPQTDRPYPLRRHDVHTAEPGRELAVEVVDLHRRYGDFEAARGVSFAVRRGEVFALLGVDGAGAGKASVLEVVERLARADRGSVRILGADPVTEGRHRRGPCRRLGPAARAGRLAGRRRGRR